MGGKDNSHCTYKLLTVKFLKPSRFYCLSWIWNFKSLSKEWADPFTNIVMPLGESLLGESLHATWWRLGDFAPFSSCKTFRMISLYELCRLIVICTHTFSIVMFFLFLLLMVGSCSLSSKKWIQAYPCSQGNQCHYNMRQCQTLCIPNVHWKTSYYRCYSFSCIFCYYTQHIYLSVFFSPGCPWNCSQSQVK